MEAKPARDTALLVTAAPWTLVPAHVRIHWPVSPGPDWAIAECQSWRDRTSGRRPGAHVQVASTVETAQQAQSLVEDAALLQLQPGMGASQGQQQPVVEQVRLMLVLRQQAAVALQLRCTQMGDRTSARA